MDDLLRTVLTLRVILVFQRGRLPCALLSAVARPRDRRVVEVQRQVDFGVILVALAFDDCFAHDNLLLLVGVLFPLLAFRC